MSASKKTEDHVLKAVKDLGADMVDVLDAIHSTLMELNVKLADMKGHLDLTTALTLSEKMGVSASDIGIEVSIPQMKTSTEVKKTKKEDESDTKQDDETQESNSQDTVSEDPCDDSGVCHYG
jgi:hypothetical protein